MSLLRGAAVFCLAFLCLTRSAAGQQSFDREMASTAQAFIRLLDGSQADAALFPFAGDVRRYWHYTPRRRPGLALRDMSSEQRDAARRLMRATLSATGTEKAEAIMALEAVLREIEGSSHRYRDPENYAWSVFGNPASYPWGWRLEGHHLSVNVTVAAPGEVAVTPAFTGSNPARIPDGPREGERVQKLEYELALQLAQSLSATQRQSALLGDRSMGNIVAGPGRPDAAGPPAGLPATALSEDQRDLLLRLVDEYVGLARDELGQFYHNLVRDGLPHTYFAWAGGMSLGEAFYYRIHGPRVLIEFDNTQDDANHVHSLWRDPVNDFGRDDLARHYRDAAPEHGHWHAPTGSPGAGSRR